MIYSLDRLAFWRFVLTGASFLRSAAKRRSWLGKVSECILARAATQTQLLKQHTLLDCDALRAQRDAATAQNNVESSQSVIANPTRSEAALPLSGGLDLLS